MSHLNELLEVTEMLLREVIAERDCLYESHADADGMVTDEEGKRGLIELDVKIDKAQAVIEKVKKGE